MGLHVLARPMPNETGDTVGIWIGPEHEELLADFDALGGSRSANLRRAMALLVAVEAVMDDHGDAPTNYHAREFRSLVRQAMLDYYQTPE